MVVSSQYVPCSPAWQFCTMSMTCCNRHNLLFQPLLLIKPSYCVLPNDTCLLTLINSCYSVQYCQCSDLFCCIMDSMFFTNTSNCIGQYLYSSKWLHPRTCFAEPNPSTLQFRCGKCTYSKYGY